MRRVFRTIFVVKARTTLRCLAVNRVSIMIVVVPVVGHVHRVPVGAQVLHQERVGRVVRPAVRQAVLQLVRDVLGHVLAAVQTGVQGRVRLGVLLRVLQAARVVLVVLDRRGNATYPS